MIAFSFTSCEFPFTDGLLNTDLWLVFYVMKRGRNDSQVLIFDRALRLDTAFVESRNKPGVESCSNKLLVPHNLAEERQRRRDSRNLVLVERASQPVNCLLTCAAPDSEFRN